jgi:hypothetical protein
MYGAHYPNGSAESSLTISIHGRSPKRLWLLPIHSTKTRSLWRAMPNTRPGGHIWHTYATPMATPTWRWRLMVLAVSVS